MARLANKVVNEGNTKLATKDDLKKLATKTDIEEIHRIIYELNKKLKNKENNTQNSTPEENTPRNNGTQNTVLSRRGAFRLVVFSGW